MERRLAQLVAVIVLLIAARMLLNFVSGPAAIVRAELAAELAQVPDRAPMTGAGERDFAALCNPLLDKPGLWRALVAPPPAPAAPEKKPAAPVAPDAPDLAALLSGLTMRPGQIGRDKMNVITPSRPDGAWMAIGDAYNGCVLESFTREEAVFRYFWEEGDRDLRLTVRRPLR